MSNFNLEKGDKFNLSKDNDQLHTVRAELEWETPEGTFPAFDLDVSLFGLKETANGPKLLKDDYFVFYNHENKKDDKTPIDTFDGAITKSPDETTGGVEWIKVRLPQVDPQTDELSVIITIHKAKQRKQTFDQVSGAKINIFNDETGDLICSYNLGEGFVHQTAVQIGSFVRDSSGDWIFEAVGVGYELELDAFIGGYTS
jgi:tellurium resistance protein TerD